MVLDLCLSMYHLWRGMDRKILLELAAVLRVLICLPPTVKLFIYIFFFWKEGSQNKWQVKIPEGQEYAPRLESAAPIRLADRNHVHYPSRRRTILDPQKKMAWWRTQAHAFRSTRESSEDVTRTLDAPPSKVRSDIFCPLPKGMRVLEVRHRAVFFLRTVRRRDG